MSVFTKVLRAGEGKKVRRLAELVADINDLEPELEALSDEELRHKTVEFRERLDQGEDLNDLLVEAFAVGPRGGLARPRPAPLRRPADGRHGPALRLDRRDEDRRGQDPGLDPARSTSTPSRGEGVHVVTVNDYLANRDAEWMGRLHRFLGLDRGPGRARHRRLEAKRAAYACDVTYGTNTEFGFDYLRDNMARSPRAHGPARPRTSPSSTRSTRSSSTRPARRSSSRGPADEAAKLYYQFASIARTLTPRRRLRGRRGEATVVPTEAGIEKVEQAARGRQPLRRRCRPTTSTS